MEGNETTQNASGKADLTKRAVALIIDGLIAGAIGRIPFIGGLIGAAYMLVRDGFDLDFMDHRSLGKKLMKLRPIRLDGKPVDMETSMRRNWVFALGPLSEVFLIIPYVGWIITLVAALAAFGVFIMEIVFTIKDQEGRRWGDSTAGTKVVEVEE